MIESFILILRRSRQMSAVFRQVVPDHSGSSERQAEAEARREATRVQQGPQVSSGHQGQEGNQSPSSSTSMFACWLWAEAIMSKLPEGLADLRTVQMCDCASQVWHMCCASHKSSLVSSHATMAPDAFTDVESTVHFWSDWELSLIHWLKGLMGWCTTKHQCSPDARVRDAR